MSLRIVYAPRALLGMTEIADYLAGQSDGLGLRFLRAVEVTCTNLAAMPEMAPRYESEKPRLADLRVWPIQEFLNHLIFYRIKASYLEVVHIVFGGRDLTKLL
jgi:plasmid stabilization system protein ParE